jgi:hypothetical protein
MSDKKKDTKDTGKEGEKEAETKNEGLGLLEEVGIMVRDRYDCLYNFWFSLLLNFSRMMSLKNFLLMSGQQMTKMWKTWMFGKTIGTRTRLKMTLANNFVPN